MQPIETLPTENERWLPNPTTLGSHRRRGRTSRRSSLRRTPPSITPASSPLFVASLVRCSGAQSLANMRNMENDLKQISMAMMFGIMGLVTNYMGLGPRPSPKT
ncbi:Protein Asterix [Striga hermonthica]|uniref:Protein Asterix n=1 Tax=Striga hermonthica TaxID=68872 RepID=A0A9N7N2E3_STRHE|nr:Protein Asterix [Striga hermonthica]